MQITVELLFGHPKVFVVLVIFKGIAFEGAVLVTTAKVLSANKMFQFQTWR
jgi:hypothetical protein